MADRRIGIVTINDDTNYGNRLQNYALQEVLRSLGWEPETLRNRPPAWGRELLVPRLLHELGDDPAGFAGRAVAKSRRRPAPNSRPAPPFLGLRRTAIAEFVRSGMSQSPYAYDERPAEYWSERYACAIVGSDQVWNPTYRRAQGIDFLDFLEPSRRVAYAASFGVERVPRYLRVRYRAWLEAIPSLSVRESRARGIVAELTGRDVPVVADPTVLVDRDVWDQLVSTQPPLTTRPYAVQFFIGDAAPAQVDWVRQEADRAGLELIDLHDLRRERFADLGPAGFIAAISRAERVYTDSFHAGIFSLTFRRPLVVRTRFERDARWDELLAQHGLVPEPVGVEGLRRVPRVDWADVDARREELRADSMAFLRAALDASTAARG